MIRGSSALFATPSSVKGRAFQRWTTDGGPSVHTAGPALAPSVWLRLLRQGNTISAEYRKSSSDPWVTLTSLPASVLVGLAVTSHSDGTLATAAFDNVTVSAGP
jgi:hypothetical protein